MAIISEVEDESSSSRPSMLPFRATFDPSNPLGFLGKVFDFLGEQSDFLTKPSAEDEIAAAVRAAKEKLRKAAEKKPVEKKETVKPVEKKTEKPTVAASSAEPMEVEKPKEEQNKETACVVPNQGNGMDLENYSWVQTLQEVTVNIPIPVGTKARSIVYEIKKNRLKVGLKGQDPIIDGELYRSVKPDDCYWNIEDQKVISVLMTKQDQMEWWKCCVKGEPEIDTQKVEPESSKLGDLDPETRQTVEKMMALFFLESFLPPLKFLESPFPLCVVTLNVI